MIKLTRADKIILMVKEELEKNWLTSFVREEKTFEYPFDTNPNFVCVERGTYETADERTRGIAEFAAEKYLQKDIVTFIQKNPEWSLEEKENTIIACLLEYLSVEIYQKYFYRNNDIVYIPAKYSIPCHMTHKYFGTAKHFWPFSIWEPKEFANRYVERNEFGKLTISQVNEMCTKSIVTAIEKYEFFQLRGIAKKDTSLEAQASRLLGVDKHDFEMIHKGSLLTGSTLSIEDFAKEIIEKETSKQVV